MKNRWMLTVNVGIIAVILTLNYFYQSNDFDFTLKCICSGSFALLGGINLCHALGTKQGNTKFYVAMLLGLIFAFLGDVLIGYDFIVGAATFALGHVLFVVAYCYLYKLCKRDLAIGGALFVCAAAFLLFFPLLRFEVPMFRVVCIAYALIISLMLGKAIGNYVECRSALTFTIALASALFFFSDLMLVFNWFVGLWDWTGHACMGTYYPALCLLAFAMYLKEKKGETP